MAGVIAGIGLGLQVLGMGSSLMSGLSQKKKAAEAERKANAALNEAKSRLEINRQEGIQVPIDSYEMAMRENTAQQMQALEGLREADPRMLAAGVGKLAAAGASATEADRQRMQEALLKRDTAIAEEESRIDRALSSVSLQEAIGYEKEAAQREQASNMQISGAIKGAGDAALGFYKAKDLYSQRQGELDVARQFQQDSGLYQGMNARQARRAMMDSGINTQGFQNLSSGLTSYVQPVTPMGMVGIQQMDTGYSSELVPMNSFTTPQ